MNNMDKIRWGIVGTGKIAKKFAEAVKNVENASLVAVASRNKETAESFAGKFGIPVSFGSYEEMACSDAIDMAYIATPHSFHLPCSALFIKSKKHVLCEKPITINEKELDQMEQLAKANNVFLMEALWTRFLPAIKEMKKLIEEGAIGKVRGISADFCYNSSNKTHHVFDRAYGGGALLDVGVYTINFASIFLGSNPVRIKAMSEIVNGVDEHTNILLSYSNGAIASLSSALTVSKQANAYIYGSEGYIFVPNFYRANEFELFSKKNKSAKYRFDYLGNGFEEEIIECNNCVLSGKTQSDIMPLAETHRIMRIMDSIRKQEGIIYPADE